MALVTAEEQALLSHFGFGPAQVAGMTQSSLDFRLNHILKTSAPRLVATIESGASKSDAEEFATVVEQAKATVITATEDVIDVVAEVQPRMADVVRDAPPAAIIIAGGLILYLMLRR